MIRSSTRCRTAFSLLLVTFILAGCEDEPPETLLASARDYLAKHDGKAAVIQIKNALQKNPDLPEGRLLLGRAFLENGDAVAAELELRKALDLKHSPDQVIPLLARSLLAQGKAAKVLAEFAGSRLETPEGRADLLTTLALAQAQGGDMPAARGSLVKALEALPEHGPARLAQARILAASRDAPGALAQLENVLVREPKNPEALILKGDLLNFQGAAEPALATYRQALEIRPDAIAAHGAVVSILLQLNRLEEAGQQLEAMRKVAGGHSQTVYLDTLLAYQQQDLKKARHLARQLVQNFPEQAASLQLAGAVEYRLKSWGQAEVLLAKALQHAPELPLARRLLVATYLQTGLPAKALATLQPSLGKIDGDAPMLALAGQVYVQNGDLQKAEQYFAQAAALDPKNVGHGTTLAMTRMMTGKAESAVGQLEELAASDSGTVADMALITSLLRRNSFDKALVAIAGLEKKQPDKPLAHDLRGRTFFALGNPAAARKSFEKALALDGAYFPALLGLAGLDMADGNPEAARQRFEKLLAADPRNTQALMALADLRRQAGSPPGDVAVLLARAISANPTAPGPRLSLVEHYLRSKDPGKAVAAAQEAVTALPEQPELLDALGAAQQAAGNFNQALATYGKLAALQPSSPQPYLRMADVHLAGQNREEAVRSLKKGLEVSPDAIEAQRRIIRIYLESGQTREALAVAREAQRQKPKAAVGFLLEGDVEAIARHWPEAAAAYRAGLKAAPSTEGATKLHGALRQLGDGGEADRFAAGWLKEHPKDGGFRSYLGDRATARKDWEAAARYYRSALEIQPDNPAVLNNLAWVTGQQKKPEALGYAEKALRLAPNQPAVMDTLAMLLMEKGETQRGLHLLQKAIELAPGNPLIRLNLAKALIQAGDKPAARKELQELNRLGESFSRHDEVAQLMGDV